MVRSAHRRAVGLLLLVLGSCAVASEVPDPRLSLTVAQLSEVHSLLRRAVAPLGAVVIYQGTLNSPRAGAERDYSRIAEDDFAWEVTLPDRTADSSFKSVMRLSLLACAPRAAAPAGSVDDSRILLHLTGAVDAQLTVQHRSGGETDALVAAIRELGKRDGEAAHE